MTRTPQSSISVDTVGGFEGKLSPKARAGVSFAPTMMTKSIHHAVYVYMGQLKNLHCKTIQYKYSMK